MLGIGTILHILTGMDALWGTLIGAAVVLIYTFAGGMWAVTLTDVVQVSLIVIGLFVIVPGAVFEAGGWSEMTSRLSAADLSIGMRHALDPPPASRCRSSFRITSTTSAAGSSWGSAAWSGRT